jgi:hypothetical protein
MKVYSYHKDTFIYIGNETADESQLEPGVYLMPAHSTPIEPPEYVEGKHPKFNKELQQWELIDYVPEVIEAEVGDLAHNVVEDLTQKNIELTNRLAELESLVQSLVNNNVS